jgi:hypothetical protein
MFHWANKKYMKDAEKFEYDLTLFKRPSRDGQLDLFD